MPRRSKPENAHRLGRHADDLVLRPKERGGFTLDAAGGRFLESARDEDGWSVRGERGIWLLRPAERGLVLLPADGGREDPERVTGRTSHFPPPGRGAVSVLLADGRLFWIVTGGPGRPGFELRGWEVPGAYWVARRTAEGWTLSPTVAGRHLVAADPALVLFAAEIVAAEAPEGGA